MLSTRFSIVHSVLWRIVFCYLGGALKVVCAVLRKHRLMRYENIGAHTQQENKATREYYIFLVQTKLHWRVFLLRKQLSYISYSAGNHSLFMLRSEEDEKLYAEHGFPSSSNKKLFQFVSISITSLAGVSDLTARTVISHQHVSSSSSQLLTMRLLLWCQQLSK